MQTAQASTTQMATVATNNTVNNGATPGKGGKADDDIEHDEKPVPDAPSSNERN